MGLGAESGLCAGSCDLILVCVSLSLSLSLSLSPTRGQQQLQQRHVAEPRGDYADARDDALAAPHLHSHARPQAHAARGQLHGRLRHGARPVAAAAHPAAPAAAAAAAAPHAPAAPPPADPTAAAPPPVSHGLQVRRPAHSSKNETDVTGVQIYVFFHVFRSMANVLSTK